jgi:hypothetical protein
VREQFDYATTELVEVHCPVPNPQSGIAESGYETSKLPLIFLCDFAPLREINSYLQSATPKIHISTFCASTSLSTQSRSTLNNQVQNLKFKMSLPSQSPSEQFLTLEESGRVDAALLTSPEKFLTRLTISSLKLLKHIAQEYGVAIEDLTSEQVISWFEKDSKIRFEQGIEAAYLKW